MRCRKLIGGLVMGAALLTSSQGLDAMGAAIEAQAERGRAGLWMATVTFDNGEPSCTAPELLTADGLIIAGNCAVNSSALYGRWRKLGPRQYAETNFVLSYGADGTLALYIKILSKYTLSEDEQSYQGTFTAEATTVDGIPVGTITGTVAGRRIAFETF
jgi:hypothetical protein